MFCRIQHGYLHHLPIGIISYVFFIFNILLSHKQIVFFSYTGLLGLMLLDCKSAQLENLVAIELMRHYGTENVYFFENSVEIDFYVPLDNLAIQVSMQVLDNIDTRERETRAFVKLNNFIPNAKCILITNSEEAVIDCDGINIEVIPIWKWLLDN